MVEDEKSNGMSLAAQTPHRMAIRARLVTRGLHDITHHLTGPTRRILVVNDEELFCRGICELLAQKGYECRPVSGGPEALAILGSEDIFDLLIHDLLNPHLDGLSLLRQAKQQFPELPVIVASAIDDKSVVDACMQNGAYAYLQLPLDVEELFATVSRVFKGGRSVHESKITAF
jgi:DNA-binding NtrC family response regulator